MQIDRRFFQVAMTEQHLDGAQVGAGFQQMSREAVSKRMGMDMLVRPGRHVGRRYGRLSRGPWL